MRAPFRGTAIACILTIGIPALTAAQEPIVFTFHARDLALVKRRIDAGDEATVAALGTLIRKADRRLAEGVYSVVTNGPKPPSGDRHDYLSQAPYWWPDPKEGDGKPYIRRDGQVNPESQGGDDEPLDKMCHAAWQLGLAWHYTGDERYAEHAAKLLRTWYLDPDTRMKPRLAFGQYVPGHNQGRETGLIETRVMLKALDAVGLIADSAAWTQNDQRQLKAWFLEFLDWMRESARGKDGREADNNLGTWCDAQAAGYALYAGYQQRARDVLDRSRKQRFVEALDDKGRMIHELQRTKSLDYCLFNLEAMMQLAILGERTDFAFWKARFEGRGLPLAVEWLAPYAAAKKPWPHKQIAPVRDQNISVLFRRAAVAYGRDDYERISAARRDPQNDETTIALELVYPHRDSSRGTTKTTTP